MKLMHDWPNRVDIACMNISSVQRMYTQTQSKQKTDARSPLSQRDCFIAICDSFFFVCVCNICHFSN